MLQTVQKNKQQQFTYGQTVQKSNSNLHMDSTYLQTVQKTMCKIHIHILSTCSHVTKKKICKGEMCEMKLTFMTFIHWTVYLIKFYYKV